MPSDRVWKKMTNYAEIFGWEMQKIRKMHQICGKQTGLCGTISTVDKTDKLITPSECTEQQ